MAYYCHRSARLTHHPITVHTLTWLLIAHTCTDMHPHQDGFISTHLTPLLGLPNGRHLHGSLNCWRRPGGVLTCTYRPGGVLTCTYRPTHLLVHCHSSRTSTFPPQKGFLLVQGCTFREGEVLSQIGQAHSPPNHSAHPHLITHTCTASAPSSRWLYKHTPHSTPVSDLVHTKWTLYATPAIL